MSWKETLSPKQLGAGPAKRPNDQGILYLRQHGQCSPEVSATGLGCTRIVEFPLPPGGRRGVKIEDKRASENEQVGATCYGSARAMRNVGGTRLE